MPASRSGRARPPAHARPRAWSTARRHGPRMRRNAPCRSHVSRCAVPADKPRTNRYEVDLDIEKRRRLGLPAEMLEQAGLEPGDRVHVQVRRDGRIVITPVTDLLGKYAGAIPGIAAAARQEQPGR